MAPRRTDIKLPAGIQIRDSGSLRIRVRPPGERRGWVWERVDAPATTAGIARASAIREEVLARQRLGITVDWCEYFPDSPRCNPADAAGQRDTFAAVAESWLRHRVADTSPSTWEGYRKRVHGIWMPIFGHMMIWDIRASDVRDAITANGWTSGKTTSNALTPLRGIFELAIEDELISRNPVGKVKARKSQRPPPDPLSSDEVRTLLDSLGIGPWAPYIWTALGTGMRTSELIGLRIGDVDLDAGTVRVHSARVDGIDTGRTKVARERTLQAEPLALRGLRAQMRRNRGRGVDHVFVMPGTGKPIQNDQAPRRAWHSACAKAGIRKRPAYQTRHTFATLHLLAGRPLLEVSALLGHDSPDTTYRHYARWIPTEITTAPARVEVMQ